MKYRFQVLDTAGDLQSWRDIIYIWDSEVGYAWQFANSQSPGHELEEPVEELVELGEELVGALTPGARLRLIESGSERVAWQFVSGEQWGSC